MDRRPNATHIAQTYMTTQEVADLVRAPSATVAYWRHIGTGPPGIRVGRRVLYPAAGVMSWLDSKVR